MHGRSPFRLLLVPCLLLAAAGCGAPATPTAKPSIRIVSPTNGSSLNLASAQVSATVTIHFSISHFTLVNFATAAQPSSGQIRLYENGKLWGMATSNSVRLGLGPGSYQFRAELVTNGKVVAISAPDLVTVVAPTLAASPSCHSLTPGVTRPVSPAETVSISLSCLPAAYGMWEPLPGSHPALVQFSNGDMWFLIQPAGSTNGSPSGVGRVTPSGTTSVFSKGLPAAATLSDLVVGPGGDLWFTIDLSGYGAGGAVGRITPSGNISVFSKGLAAGDYPRGLVMGPGGDLWFTVFRVGTSGTRPIGRITPSGTISLFPSSLAAAAVTSDLLPGAGGDLWFTVQPARSTTGTLSAIGRVNPSGSVTFFTKGLSGWASLGRLVSGPRGDLWFTAGTNSGQSAIGRITPSGAITLFSKGIPMATNPSGQPSGGPAGNLVFGSQGDMWFVACIGWFAGVGPCNGSMGIGQISPSGTISVFTKGLPAHAYGGGLVPGPGGDMWFVVETTSPTGQPSVGKITPSGMITLYSSGLPTGASLSPLLPGPNGTLWFETSVGTSASLAIGQITPSGTVTLFHRGLPANSIAKASWLVSGANNTLWFGYGSLVGGDGASVAPPENFCGCGPFSPYFAVGRVTVSVP